jgi:hypothetical protein
MNTYQLVLPTTTITKPNVYVLGTQTMNHSITHTIVPINYQITWSQPVTPIVPSKTSMLSILTYPMWYNVIPPFVPLDLILYPAYPTGTKGLDSLIFRNYTWYVPRNVYPIPKQHVVPPTHIPNFIGNQFPTVVQLVTSKDKQPIVLSMLTTV